MISKEEIQNLTTLARLQLTEAEQEGLGKDISNILDYVGQVSAVEMSDTKATPPLRNVMRVDERRSAEDTMAGKEDAVKEAFPKREGDFNSVRKIIEK